MEEIVVHNAAMDLIRAKSFSREHAETLNSIACVWEFSFPHLNHRNLIPRSIDIASSACPHDFLDTFKIPTQIGHCVQDCAAAMHGRQRIHYVEK